MEITHSGPDDPYIVKSRWDDEGLHIIVEAHVLPFEGNIEEVKAETERRAKILHEHIIEIFNRR